MVNNQVTCQHCNKTFPEIKAYKYIQDDLGHKVYWCSQECLEASKKSNKLS